MTLVLRAARMFDGERVVAAPLVHISDGRIAAIETETTTVDSEQHVLDLGDVTLIPGLIDAHVHLGFDASRDPVAQMRKDDDATLLLRMRQAAERALNGGVTTVRDLGDRRYLALTLRDWFKDGNEPGPEIVAAGPPITVTGGHCHFMGGEADGELEVRRAVRERVKAGANVIKIMATGGHMTPGTNPAMPQYSTAELKAAVDEAHRLGRLLTAHAHGPIGIQTAVEAGVDGIEHCSFRVPGGRQPEPHLIERIAEQRIAVCPTVGALPSASGNALAESFLPILEDMHARGVRLIGGTDAGISPVKPHDGMPHCVAFLARAGLTNLQALSAATCVAAEACGVGTRKGRLAAGWDADIVAIPSDPTVDLSGLFDVQAVFCRGVRAR